MYYILYLMYWYYTLYIIYYILYYTNGGCFRRAEDTSMKDVFSQALTAQLKTEWKTEPESGFSVFIQNAMVSPTCPPFHHSYL